MFAGYYRIFNHSNRFRLWYVYVFVCRHICECFDKDVEPFSRRNDFLWLQNWGLCSSFVLLRCERLHTQFFNVTLALRVLLARWKIPEQAITGWFMHSNLCLSHMLGKHGEFLFFFFFLKLKQRFIPTANCELRVVNSKNSWWAKF